LRLRAASPTGRKVDRIGGGRMPKRLDVNDHRSLSDIRDAWSKTYIDMWYGGADVADEFTREIMDAFWRGVFDREGGSVIFELDGASRVEWSANDLVRLLHGLDPFCKDTFEMFQETSNLKYQPTVTPDTYPRDSLETWLQKWRMERYDFEAWYVERQCGGFLGGPPIGEFWPAPTSSVIAPCIFSANTGFSRTRPARARVVLALNELYPHGVPDQTSVRNDVLWGEVNDWLCRVRLPKAGRDTVLRAAGRRSDY
jgi:hypothetical protein